MNRVRRVSLVAVVAVAAVVHAFVNTSVHAATVITDDQSCWTMVNELAAAAVFTDLSDEKLETIYVLLDQLQDHCEAQTYDEATKTAQMIEIHVGK